jgi:hypothetical protein
VPINTHQYILGSIVTVRPNLGNLEKTWYSFKGWALTATASTPTYTVTGDTVTPAGFTITTNVDLYAVWEIRPTFSVTYHANWPNGEQGTGTVPMDPTLYFLHDNASIMPNMNDLQKPSYTFIGWLHGTETISVFNLIVTPPIIEILDNIHLYAIWQESLKEDRIRYGSVENVRLLCLLWLPEGETVDDDLLNRFRCMTTDWIHGKLEPAGATLPIQPVPDRINHCAALYAAGCYLHLRTPEGKTHDYIERAIKEIDQYLQLVYSIDPNAKPQDLPREPVIITGTYIYNW